MKFSYIEGITFNLLKDTLNTFMILRTKCDGCKEGSKMHHTILCTNDCGGFMVVVVDVVVVVNHNHHHSGNGFRVGALVHYMFWLCITDVLSQSFFDILQVCLIFHNAFSTR